MKKALSNTKVTVKLRKSVHHDNEWYLLSSRTLCIRKETTSQAVWLSL